MGIGLSLQDQGGDYTYDWVIVGSDVIYTFILEAREPASGLPRMNWISAPISGDYGTTFDIVDDFETMGPPDTDDYLTAVSEWDAYNQGLGATSSYFPMSSIWLNEYALDPGMGICLSMQDRGMDYTYNWTISLITPAIP